MKKRIMLTLVCLLAAIGWVAAQNSPISGDLPPSIPPDFWNSEIPPLPVSLFQLRTMNRLSELPYW